MSAVHYDRVTGQQTQRRIGKGSIFESPDYQMGEVIREFASELQGWDVFQGEKHVDHVVLGKGATEIEALEMALSRNPKLTLPLRAVPFQNFRN